MHYGVSAVLSHVLRDGVEHPIAYVCLSSNKKKYAQIEKRGLGPGNYLEFANFINMDHIPPLAAASYFQLLTMI